MGDVDAGEAGGITVQKEKDAGVMYDHQNPASSTKENSLKLDPHGFPLQPQPTSDPMGKTYADQHRLRSDVAHRSIELESMVETVRIDTSVASIISESVYAGSDCMSAFTLTRPKRLEAALIVDRMLRTCLFQKPCTSQYRRHHTA